MVEAHRLLGIPFLPGKRIDLVSGNILAGQVTIQNGRATNVSTVL